MSEEYHTEEVKICNKLDINQPEVHTGGDRQYKEKGFMCKEDYDTHMRRYESRLKSDDLSTGEAEY